MLRTLSITTAVGGALGAFLDRGLSVLLPCAPWPEPFLTGWGWLVGLGIGLAGGALVSEAARRGALAPPPPGALARASVGGIVFVCVTTTMIGGIGYASGRRASLERDGVRLREARKDLDKKLVPEEEALRRISRIEARMSSTRDDARAYASTRRAATAAAVLSSAVGMAFAAMAVVYRRALATRPAA